MSQTAIESERPPTPVGWAALAILVAFVASGVVRRFPDRPTLALLAGSVAVAAAAAAIFAQRGVLVLPAAAISTAAVALLGNGTASNVCWFSVCVLAGWCALTAEIAVVAVFSAGVLVLLLAERLTTSADPGWFAWIGGTVFSVVGCLFGRRQHELVVALRAAQAGLEQRAQTEERARIARELHDVIAHSLTVSLMHLSSARLTVRDDPGDADRALAEAERLSRASLDEVRHAVGMLHREGASDPRAPLPASIDVPALIADLRSAGADVQATIDGDLDTVAVTVGLAGYRILQEALTNASRHAARSPITVRFLVAAEALELDVRTVGPPGSGAGLGLTSMRERAAAVGGSCDAGPFEDGWRVHAQLPLQR
jgi:signal transduction histidine kinase